MLTVEGMSLFHENLRPLEGTSLSSDAILINFTDNEPELESDKCHNSVSELQHDLVIRLRTSAHDQLKETPSSRVRTDAQGKGHTPPLAKFDQEGKLPNESEAFTSIVEEVTIHCAYFCKKEECTGTLDLFLLFKCTFAIRQLLYSTVPDALDEYLQMGTTTSRLSLEHFCRSVMEIFGLEYLRKPTVTDIESYMLFKKKSMFFHKSKEGFIVQIRSHTHSARDSSSIIWRLPEFLL
ncbi:hypothetical protein Tco_0979197, partial [Tanacetum coccineum]